jgi:hypothetical protein
MADFVLAPAVLGAHPAVVSTTAMARTGAILEVRPKLETDPLALHCRIGPDLTRITSSGGLRRTNSELPISESLTRIHPPI